MASNILYYILLFVVKIISYLPFRVLYILSDLFFYPLYYLIRYRRKIVRKNLTESFPDKTLHEIIRIEKKFYHFFLDMMLESCKLISISPKEIKKRMKYTNLEMVNQMLADGKTISAFAGHYGNWEWISAIGLWLNEEATGVQIYHKLSNKAMDRIMKRMRERAGNICVEMHKTVRFMANAASDNKSYIIGLIADQSPRKRDAKYFIQFLNHNVPVLTGTEKMTKRFGYEALFLNMKRVKRGYYECEFIPLHDNPKSLPDFELTNLYYQQLEQKIIAQPELYLWTHNRFRLAQKNDL